MNARRVRLSPVGHLEVVHGDECVALVKLDVLGRQVGAHVLDADQAGRLGEILRAQADASGGAS